MASSSWSSRRRHAASDSPGWRLPPGNSHLSGCEPSGFRWQTSTVSPRVITPAATSSTAMSVDLRDLALQVHQARAHDVDGLVIGRELEESFEVGQGRAVTLELFVDEAAVADLARRIR